MGTFPQLRPAALSGSVPLGADTPVPTSSPYLVLSELVRLPPSGRGWLVFLTMAVQASASKAAILSSYPAVTLPDGTTIQNGAEETYASGTNRSHSAPAITAYVPASGGPVTFAGTLTADVTGLTAIALVGGNQATLLDWSAIPLD